MKIHVIVNRDGKVLTDMQGSLYAYLNETDAERHAVSKGGEKVVKAELTLEGHDPAVPRRPRG